MYRYLIRSPQWNKGIQDREILAGTLEEAQSGMLDDEFIVSWQLVEAKTSAVPQNPSPAINKHPAIFMLVLEDIEERVKMGTKKYGTPLQPFNGRSALRDAYQEAMDLIFYLRQMIYEDEYSKPAG